MICQLPICSPVLFGISYFLVNLFHPCGHGEPRAIAIVLNSFVLNVDFEDKSSEEGY